MGAKHVVPNPARQAPKRGFYGNENGPAAFRRCFEVECLLACSVEHSDWIVQVLVGFEPFIPGKRLKKKKKVEQSKSSPSWLGFVPFTSSGKTPFPLGTSESHGVSDYFLRYVKKELY